MWKTALIFHFVESGIAARDISVVAKRMEEVPGDRHKGIS